MRGRLRRFLACLALLTTGCAGLPPLQSVPSTVIADTLGSELAQSLRATAREHPGETGIYMLGRALDAFAARAVIAGAAQRSLDVQYYIWHDDRTGRLMMDALWEAAERGVRVRLLLDDLPTKGLDPTLVALDAHENAEVRLYNPWVHRSWRWVDWVIDLRRMHRRMHNKSFTADNAITIIGGRNIGNEYFGLGNEMLFADLDLVAVGAVVDEVSSQFDIYWNSRSAYPVSQLVDPLPAARREAIRARLARVRLDSASQAYLEAVRQTPLVRQLTENQPIFTWSPATLVFDDPSKTRLSSPADEALLTPDLLQAVGPPTASFDLVSPYFVPGEEGTALMEQLVQQGVRVRVLTNSLAATDVAAVHAGYVKWRRRLLRAGVELYEYHPVASRATEARATARAAIGESGATRRPNSALLSLHSKTFAMDSTRLFVGSFNFDPRSILYNTELGVVLRSDSLARALHDDFARDVPRASYEVRLGPRGLEWLEQTPTGIVVYHREPRASLWRRLTVNLLRWLPIDLLL